MEHGSEDEGTLGKHGALSLVEIYWNEDVARVPKEATKGKRGAEDSTKKRVSLPRTIHVLGSF